MGQCPACTEDQCIHTLNFHVYPKAKSPGIHCFACHRAFPKCSLSNAPSVSEGSRSISIINKTEQEGIFIECSPLQSRLPQLQQIGFQSLVCESLSGNDFLVVAKSSSGVRGRCSTHIRATWDIFPPRFQGKNFTVKQKGVIVHHTGQSHMLKETHRHRRANTQHSLPNSISSNSLLLI